MTIRQRIMKFLYPVLMKLTRAAGKNSLILQNKNDQPMSSIYDLSVQLNNGKTISLEQFRGKKLLLVNTASNCGYTNQYEALQELYGKYSGKLEIIGFPANDFHEQEKGNDEEIAQFCKVNFGVTFPLVKKSVVVPSDNQHPVYHWLTSKQENGWNEQAPTWNFSKYLLDEQGNLINYFDPSVSPLSSEVVSAVESKTTE
ncbi:glutathione peroxidase [Pseudoflavitalea sp. G-6-1-2]|uniref:glutathione peroxidase n=1 Tax=Pseudoflavitalea sp. G-6-1-2 TaxID=2728841 RepID=UPI00146D9143|nr:glutathione peroxidase [Pseudoflavitalea sp. G-6-1-2]NML19728.1 glutathione peroxidase [Pseudoflavitalea sp. G-6-1-2]